MIIVYDSLTNQTKRFAEKIGLKVIDINAYDDIENDEKILLITRSYNFGEIPLTTISFLQKHAISLYVLYGNRNWENYGA